MKSLGVDSGVKSLIVDELTIKDLKYWDNISSITLPIVAGVEMVGKGNNTSSGVGCGVATSDVEGGLLSIRTGEWVLVFFYTK